MPVIDLSEVKWRKVWDMLRWAKPGKSRDEIMDLVAKAAGNQMGDTTKVEMPECLKNFLEGITPEQADQLWTYFDSSSMDEMIELVAPKSANFAEAQAEWLQNLRPHAGYDKSKVI